MENKKFMNEYIGALKKYAVFSGRATRREYWMFVLYNTIIGFIYLILIGFILSPFRSLQLNEGNKPTSFFFIFIFISLLYTIFTFIPFLALTVRRLHDTGHSGWWSLIGWTSIGINHFTFKIGIILLMIFTLRDSQPGDNKYGPNPKEIQSGYSSNQNVI